MNAMTEPLTHELEDLLLELREQRRDLSEKSLCVRFGLSRSKLQRAVRQARKRRSSDREAKCLTTEASPSGK